MKIIMVGIAVCLFIAGASIAQRAPLKTPLKTDVPDAGFSVDAGVAPVSDVTKSGG